MDIDFREVCQNLYDGIHITDGEGRVLFVNEAYTRTTGIRSEDILGRKVAEIEAEGVFYTGSVTERVLQTRQRVNSVATVLGLNKDLLVTGTPIFDKKGNIRLVVTNTRDFPALKNLEKQLLALEEEHQKTSEELEYLRHLQHGDRQIIYRSEAMASVMELIRQVAQTDVTVLITGESGTGKELIANELYRQSARRDKPFIKVNCAAIPPDLLESELFGYEAGAFTGARKAGKAGMFELADKGIILLDEIGDMPMALQAKLLRVLQQKELIRVGGNHTVKLDIRVLASTNKNLQEEVKRGNFREDLFYRLNVVPIEIKPLRERKEDIPVLAEAFLAVYNKKYNKEMQISSGGINQLVEYAWPGNTRELENLIERIVVTNPPRSVISRRHVFTALNTGSISPRKKSADTGSLKEQMAKYEKAIILHAIEQEGSIRKAAKYLGVDHSTLVKKCRSYEQDGR